jgi:hypothetical protein
MSDRIPNMKYADEAVSLGNVLSVDRFSGPVDRFSGPVRFVRFY